MKSNGALLTVICCLVIPGGCASDISRQEQIEICTNIPPGVVVDRRGCPRDDDNDGVAGYLDQCPGTPSGVSVDNSGCPRDDDKN